jgi:BlaI family penicillinase repressor
LTYGPHRTSIKIAWTYSSHKPDTNRDYAPSYPPKPTDFELEILQELWRNGPSTVRTVHEVLSKRRSLVYTTVLKAMQVMHEKGILNRDDSSRSHIYSPAIEEDATKSRLLDSVVNQVFGGSAAEMAMHALSKGRTSSEELKKLQELLDTIEPDDERGFD